MSDRPLQLMLVDEDPVFRLGLKVWLEQQGDFVVVAEAGTATEAIEEVRSRFQPYQQSLNSPPPRKKNKAPVPPLDPLPAPPLDLVILDLGLGARESESTPGLQLCKQLKTAFPRLPVLVLSALAEPALQAAAERMGANGFGTRSMSVRRLAQLIREVAVLTPENSPKQPSPQPTIQAPAIQPPTKPPPVVQPVKGTPNQSVTSPVPPADSRSLSEDASNQSTDRQANRQTARSDTTLSRLDDIPGPLTAMRISMRLSGQRQIDQSLAALARQRTGSWLNRAIIDGKQRELNAARWLVSAIWRTPRFDDGSAKSGRRSGNAVSRGAEANSPPPSSAWIRAAQQGGYGQNYADMTAARYLDRESLVPNATAALANMAATESRLQARPSEVQNVVFEGVFAKLQRPLKNISESPLEVDILRADKKLELFYLVLRQLEELLADLRASEVKPGQLSMRSHQVVHDLWDAVNTEFFGKYYTVRVGNVEEEVVTLLQQEKPFVQAQILDRIPMVTAMFGHWLFQEPMIIESSSYVATTPQAIAYSERLLENLLIQVANAVVQPLLNRLADVESIKKSLYTSRLMSSREIERFRNDLSWRYRLDRLVNEPKAIFESRYNLYVLTPVGINAASIYAPRRAELDQLGGIPLVVTLAMETRDALSPRLRNAISFVGSTVVYVLTEVLGRGIGLVGRGVLKGVGNIRQEGKRDRSKKVYREQPYQNNSVEDPYSQDFNEWE